LECGGSPPLFFHLHLNQILYAQFAPARCSAEQETFESTLSCYCALSASASADGQPDLWQTGCSYGTVFALRVSLVRMQQARRKNRAGHSNPARNCENW
jgi:hypothetical protein